MQTTAADKQQTTQATALCVDCTHQVDLGNVGLPRICVLPANTGIDLVAGGPAWLPCTLARADSNIHCGPDGLGFKARQADGKVPPGFSEFWDAYPVQRNQAPAIAAWKRLNPSPELQQTIIRAARAMASHPQWEKENARFTPSAALWLRSARWKDFSGSAGQPSPASLQSLRAQPRETDTPQKQTHACGRAHQCHHGLPLAAMRQRVARLAQTVFRRFGISVSWAPSCGDVGCVDSTSLATGKGAHPSTPNTPAN